LNYSLYVLSCTLQVRLSVEGSYSITGAQQSVNVSPCYEDSA